MKSIFFILLALITLSTNIFAQGTYIRVLSNEDKNLIFSTSYQLEELGYKTYATQYNGINRIYTGPFSSYKSANSALKIIKSYVSKNAAIVSLDANNKEVAYSIKRKYLTKYHSQKSNPSNTRKTETSDSSNENENENNDDYSKFFIGLYGGMGVFDVEEISISGSVPLNFVLDDKSYGYGAEIGYYFTKEMYLTLNYQQSVLENLSFSYIFTSLNYKPGKFLGFYPYIGGLVGYNAMTWKNHPVDTETINDIGFTFNMGAHIGAEIPLGDYFSIYTYYRYIKLDQLTTIKLDTGEKDILYTSEQSFNAGIKINLY